jgi:hypothetical protein
MSFLAPKVDAPSSSPERQSYDASGPVPVGFGRFRVGMKLLESPFNYFQRDHGDKRPKGNCYTLVAAGCHGPVQRIFRLWINGKPRWEFQCERQNGEYFRDINYSWDGANWRVRVYWGDPDQPADPMLTGSSLELLMNEETRSGKVRIPAKYATIAPPRNPDGSARVHPPYAGIFYIIFYALHFGYPDPHTGQTSLPAIEAEVIRTPEEHIGGSHWHTQTFGVNPVSAMRDLLTHSVYGADLPARLVPDDKWAAAAERMHSEGYNHARQGGNFLSPVWASNQSLAQLLADFFSYYDGFLRLRDGALIPDWFPNQLGPIEEVTTLSRDDCIEEADIDPDGWENTISELTIKFRSSEHLAEEAITERSIYNRLVTDRGTRKTVDAPFVIHNSLARRIAHRVLVQQSQPAFHARLKVLRQRAVNPDGSLLGPGDLVYLNYQPYALQLLCRVVEREDRTGEVMLSLINERGRFAEDFAPLPEQRLLPGIEAPGEITRWRLFELPDALALRVWPPMVSVLWEAPSRSVIGALPWISPTGQYTGEEQQLEMIGISASTSSLAAAVSVADNSITFADELSLSHDFSSSEDADGMVLALIDDELVSLGELLDADGINMTYAVSRARFGTTAAVHHAGTTIWVLPKANLLRAAFEHELLRWPLPYDPASATVHLRMAAVNGFEVGELNAPRAITLRDRTPTPPVITAITEQRGGVRIDWQPLDPEIAEVRVLRAAVTQNGTPLVGPFFFSSIGSLPPGALTYSDRSPNLYNQSFFYTLQAIDSAGRESPIVHPSSDSGSQPAFQPTPPLPHTTISFKGWHRIATLDNAHVTFLNPHNLHGGEALILRSSLSLPDGLDQDTTYYAMPTSGTVTRLVDSNFNEIPFSSVGAAGAITVFKREVSVSWTPSVDPFLLKSVIRYRRYRNSDAPLGELLVAPHQSSATIEDWYPANLLLSNNYDFSLTLTLWDSFGQPGYSVHTIQNT